MSITSDIQAALAGLTTAHSDLGVTVVYGSQSATGLRVLTNKQTTPDEFGQRGSMIYTVRVSGALIDEPARGAHLVVNGEQAYVLESHNCGGILHIQCSDTQPVEGL